MSTRPLPLVSAIVPVYNRPRLVREAVESILAQTFQDFEVIVVDDGSTDDTPFSLDRICGPGGSDERADGPAGSPAGGSAGPRSPRGSGGGSEPRLRVRRIEHDGHPGAVRNRGAEWARGRYLAFLDADDLWQPRKLERQIGLHGAAALSHTRELWLRNGKEVSQRKQKHAREGWLFPDALRKCIIGPSTVMVSREVFEAAGGFREDLEIAEDYELWLRLTAGRQVAYLDEALTVKRAGHGDQLSKQYDYIEPFRIRALRDLVERGAFDGIRPPGGPSPAALARAELARKCRIHAQGCEKRGRLREAEAYRREAALYSDE